MKAQKGARVREREGIKPDEIGSRFYLFRNTFWSPYKREIRIAALRRRAMHRQLPFSRGGYPYLVSPTTIGDGLDPRRLGTPVEGLGWSMQCFHRNQTRRPPPLPTMHSTEGCSLRLKTYRYFPATVVIFSMIRSYPFVAPQTACGIHCTDVQCIFPCIMLLPFDRRFNVSLSCSTTPSFRGPVARANVPGFDTFCWTLKGEPFFRMNVRILWQVLMKEVWTFSSWCFCRRFIIVPLVCCLGNFAWEISRFTGKSKNEACARQAWDEYYLRCILMKN